MPNQIDLQRLDKIRQDIVLLGLRFPVATIAKRTGLDKGNISKMLRGNDPCSNTFINRFYASFGEELDKAQSNREVNGAPEAYPIDSRRSEKLKAIANTLTELAAIINQIV